MLTAEAHDQETTDGFQSGNLTAALEAWAQAIGSEYVDASPQGCYRYGRSTSPWSQEPLAVVRPATVQQVQDVVQIAQLHKVPLYSISGGKNWGLGDACPTTAGQVVLDLRRLNAIREVNSELCYVVIEAGVTQQQLYDYLAENAPNLAFDATGAGPNATIVGNIMERGFGHSPYGDRFHNSCNYEVILADGRIIHTGFGQYPNARSANLLKAGLGPSLDGLFTQSNLGIVTAMTLWLMPKPKCLEAFAFSVRDDAALACIVDALRPLRLSGVLPSTVHIANDLRLISSKMTYPWDLTKGRAPLPASVRQSLRNKFDVGSWNVLGGLYGGIEMVHAARKELRRALRGIARPIFINDYRLIWANRFAEMSRRIGFPFRMSQKLETVTSAFALLKGEPVSEHLRGGGWRSANPVNSASNDPLERGDGLIWVSPTLPMTGRDAQRINELAGEIVHRHEFDPLMTFVSISGRAMCCPISICYDKNRDDETLRAKKCYEQLITELFKNGYVPYRLGIQSMNWIDADASSVTDKIRECLDPKHIIAPGRYANNVQ